MKFILFIFNISLKFILVNVDFLIILVDFLLHLCYFVFIK